MGRKPLGKQAMTDAQRQRKRRQTVRKAKREGEVLAKRAKNEARIHANPPKWEVVVLPGRPPMATIADEIAYQIEEMLAGYPEVGIDDVVAAIERRFAVGAKG